MHFCFFCSCSDFGGNIVDKLSPPKLSGELYDIQKALEKSVGQDINLVYPTSGNYRSAIITKDVDSDGKQDVFTFYSTKTDDKTTVMHLNYIKWNGEEWVSVSDLQMDCSGVESVEFAKLDNGNSKKIVVNWNRYSPTDKKLSIYKIDNGFLDEIISTEYSVFATCDFDADGTSEIVAVDLDKENKKSTATLLSLAEDGLLNQSSCELRGDVLSYYTPTLSRFTDGTPALFIDAECQGGLLTEVLFYRNGKLNRSFVNGKGQNLTTFRASTVRSADFDGDGCVDIPLAEKLPLVAGSAEADSVYVTVWNSFDGSVLTPIARSVINYTDGYFMTVPNEWIDNFTVIRNTELNLRIFLRWDGELEKTGEEIMRIQVLPIKNWEGQTEEYKDYFEVARDSDKVYVVRLSNSALNPGEDFVRNNLKIIGETREEIKNTNTIR